MNGGKKMSLNRTYRCAKMVMSKDRQNVRFFSFDWEPPDLSRKGTWRKLGAFSCARKSERIIYCTQKTDDRLFLDWRNMKRYLHQGGDKVSKKYEDWITDEGLIKIEGWARDGLINEQIAANMGISRSTLNAWCDKYPDISNALKRGKEVVDRQVENALLKRALGYEYEEVSEEYDEDGMLAKKKVTKKQVAPDTTAQIFWLKNRKRAEWCDRQTVEVSTPIDDSAKEMREYLERRQKKNT